MRCNGTYAVGFVQRVPESVLPIRSYNSWKRSVGRVTGVLFAVSGGARPSSLMAVKRCGYACLIRLHREPEPGLLDVHEPGTLLNL